ncbi:MAG: hypothetical protein ACRCW6_00550 [Mycoplasmoidaceae bacterium]
MSIYLTLIINIIIIGSVVIIIPFAAVIVFSFIKFKNLRRVGLCLNMLTTSMLIVLSCFGFFRESLSLLSNKDSPNLIKNYNGPCLTLVLISIFLFGIFLGIILSFLVKYLIILKTNSLNSNFLDTHTKNLSNNLSIPVKNALSKKWSAIILLLNHRIIESIALGMMLVQTSNNNFYSFPLEKIGFLSLFILHMIPEAFFIYYRQIEMKIVLKKSLTNLLIMKIIIIPLMTIGAFIIQWLPHNNSFNWILPFLYIVTGTTLLFISIIELIPEFIENRNMSVRSWYTCILFFLFGTIFSIAISLID